MNVCGIDFSSHAIDIVHLALDNDGPPRWDRFDLEGQDAFERARDVAHAMPSKASAYWDDVIAVGIEHPAGRHGVGPLLRMQGAILACIPPRMLVQPWPPGKWRHECDLPGNASKGLVALHSKERLLDHFIVGEKRGYKVYDSALEDVLAQWPQDAHDAHLIAHATRNALQVAA